MCLGGKGKGGESSHGLAGLLGKDSVRTSEQEGSSEPFQSTLLVVQIGKLRPNEWECIFE